MFMDRKTQYHQDVNSSQLIFNAISIKIPASLGTDKLSLKFMSKDPE